MHLSEGTRLEHKFGVNRIVLLVTVFVVTIIILNSHLAVCGRMPVGGLITACQRESRTLLI